MPIVALGLGLFFFAFLLHLIRWRLAPPADSARVLLLTFVLGILGGLGAVLLLGWMVPGMSDRLPANAWGVLHALLLALGLAASYVMTYPAIEVESPTLVMIQAIARRGAAGMPREFLFERLSDAELVAPRVRDLLADGFAVEEQGRLHLSDRGCNLVGLFVFWRRLLGAREGG